MSVLSDRGIRRAIKAGELGIYPFNEECLQPASYDLHLGDGFKFLLRDPERYEVIDPEADSSHLVDACVDSYGEDGSIVLQPNEFALGTTQEILSIPTFLICQIGGKSSLARLGLVVHQQAGLCDPGFCGRVTLEFSCVSGFPIILRPGMRIAQAIFYRLDAPCERAYGHPALHSRYQGQLETTAARYIRPR